MNTRTIVALALLSTLLCSCGWTALTKATTILTEKDGQGNVVREIAVESRPDAHIKFQQTAEGYSYEVDNRGKQGWTERMGDAAVDMVRKNIKVGVGGTSTGTEPD